MLAIIDDKSDDVATFVIQGLGHQRLQHDLRPGDLQRSRQDVVWRLPRRRMRRYGRRPPLGAEWKQGAAITS
jgi:hypothetical protein